ALAHEVVPTPNFDAAPEGSFVSAARMGYAEPTRAERDTLPPCTDGMLNGPFLGTDNITSITPLGNISVPAHSLPTEHLYINVAEQPSGVATLPITAPGDIWITHISGGSGPDQSSSDYAVHFAVCQDVFGYFGHFDELSPLLQEIVDSQGCPAGTFPGDRDCSMQVMAPVAAAAPMGTVRTTGNFDLGMWDMTRLREFANDDRVRGRSRFIQCAIEYFEDALRDRLFGLLDSEGDGCGRVSYDIPGALQGNWFLQGPIDQNDDKSVFFGGDNLDRDGSIVSVSGVISEPGKMELTERDSGLVNRRFDQVTADGQIYCYERDGTGRSEQYSQPGRLFEGHLLVRLTTDAEMLIEHRDGPCPSVLVFQNPYTYVR
ncbi:MAG: hypothetical protein V3S98_03170, partial [Dehalococcoidia bacterium]